jgi:hypothetical protein
MIHPWDSMIAGDDAEVAAEIRADAVAYTRHFLGNRNKACVAIEQKYGLSGLSPQQVSEQLCEMSKPAEGGTA